MTAKASGPPYSLDPEILWREVRVDTYRSRGAGGQHVNRTESGVRLTHVPSSVVVTASDSRSQIRNRAIAMTRLIKRLERINRVPRPRRPTRVSTAARARRMDAKRHRGERKRLRRRPAHEE